MKKIKNKQIKPPLSPNQKLFKKYLELSKKFNKTGSWLSTRNATNKAEHLINKVKAFINKNPRLRRKHDILLKTDTKEAIKDFKREITQAREEHRRKRSGIQTESEKS